MNDLFDITGKVAVVTGGAGVLGSNISRRLVKAGARVAIVDIRKEQLDARQEELKELGGEVMALEGSVLDIDALDKVSSQILEKWGKIDFLINAAGGNLPGATLDVDQSFFDMDMSDFNAVTDLNMNGTILPCMVFGKVMADQKYGSIINVSSMATYSAITRVPGYSVAKTGINIFTKWLASEVALKFGEGIRVNAIAPGFFIGDQNRKVLLNEDGSLTERSEKVIGRTPMKRFGNLDELNGAVQFLCSDAASFITGVILPIDGGFSAFSGV
ncbi:SDR family oxidoreductase [Puteibacter caeruleilacunae]|nr:SDR family oxidoreductase [Puteibacter caeruleilacunae]